MKYFFWKLFGQRFWMRFISHYESGGKSLLSEWEQTGDEIRNHRVYQLVS